METKKKRMVKIDRKERIAKALEYAVTYGGIDGAHHKDWVIDQMVRALTGCPMKTKSKGEGPGAIHYEVQGESREYKKLVKDACSEGSEWDVGIPP